jgi:probable rRNA maturation factor
MSHTLSLRNRQRVRRVDTRLLRQLTLHVLRRELKIGTFELAIHLVGAREMAQVNWDFLQHEGSTDVVTFDHSSPEFRVPSSEFRIADGADEPRTRNLKLETGLHGELFICLDDAVKQAREFRTTWQGELARYVIHGLLHLCGHDDLSPGPRRTMKREENRLVRLVAKEFALDQLATREAKAGTRQLLPRKRTSKR